MICMLRMLVVFFVWEVTGLLCFGSDLECCCLLSVHQRHADPVDNFTVHFVTIKCLGNVVLKSMAARTRIGFWKQSRIRVGGHAVFSFV